MSHLCHNQFCADLFDIVKEKPEINVSRNYYVSKGVCTKEHSPACRLDLKWKGGKGDWLALLETTQKEAPLVGP